MAADPKPVRIASMILAGGRVGELSVLTYARPKSALPFAGYFRIIDFPLSALMHAGINNVGILSQYRPASLIEHVGTGESWDFVGLDRGAKVLPPFVGDEASDWYRGNADAVAQNLNYLRDLEADLALILSGDHIYSMDYRALIEQHMERGADVTVGFKRQPYDPRFGYGTLDDEGRLVDYVEKPKEPHEGLASLTIYLANTAVLYEIFGQMGNGEAPRFVEFGRDVLPYLIGKYRVFGFEHEGYWAYTRTVGAYFRAHQDLLDGTVDVDDWGVRTNLQDTLVASQPPARFGPRAQIENSLISTGCEVNGTVIRSILSPGVRVEEGATVVDSILCHNTWIQSGSVVHRTIADKHITVGREATLGASSAPDGSAHEGISVLGKSCVIETKCSVAPGATVVPGERLDSGSRRDVPPGASDASAGASP